MTTIHPDGPRPVSSQSIDGERGEVVDWTDLGRSMWDFLTGRRAAIHYRFEDMAVEVPRDTGSNAPRATWKVHGTLTITTTDAAVPAPSEAPTPSAAGER